MRSRVIVGNGEVIEDATVVVAGERIQRVSRADPAIVATQRIDARGRTLMPGLIDTHVHIGWHFDRETGRLHSGDSTDGEADRALYAAGNAWAMLESGVTTVQSLGGPEDVPLRDAIAGGTLPGPRVITSIQPITSGTGDPAEIRDNPDVQAA